MALIRCNGFTCPRLRRRPHWTLGDVPHTGRRGTGSRQLHGGFVGEQHFRPLLLLLLGLGLLGLGESLSLARPDTDARSLSLRGQLAFVSRRRRWLLPSPFLLLLLVVVRSPFLIEHPLALDLDERSRALLCGEMQPGILT